MKRSKSRQSGFSLMETLLAVGTLAVGMVFVAGTFLASVYFSAVSTERTISTVVADEAFAKIRLYGLDPNHASLKTDGYVPYEQLVTVPPDEQFYPSTSTNIDRQYCWTALCRRMEADGRLVQITVMVLRRAGEATRYWARAPGAGWPAVTRVELPRPLRVNLVQATGSTVINDVAIRDAVADDGIDERMFISDGAILVDDRTGEIYRVYERYAHTPERIRLDRPWAGADLASTAGAWAWVVPRPPTGGRDPLVAIYQRVLRF